jgi:CheY-like chemotaxis protein
MFRILLVEDNEMNRDMLSRRLRRKGFAVSVAVDGLQGLAAARDSSPDLILMDLSLPGIDGWEATRRLKANPLTQSIPIIALTAHAMAGDRERAFEAGCDDYDMKPIDFVRLLAKIEAILMNANELIPRQTSDAEPEVQTQPETLTDLGINPGLLRHDLIGPLVRIIGYCELLAEDAEAIGRTHRSQSLQEIRTLAHEIRRAIDGILLRPLDPGQMIELESLATSVLPTAHTMIHACEALKDASDQAPDRDSFLEDLERIRSDAQLLISMTWQIRSDRIKSY